MSLQSPSLTVDEEPAIDQQQSQITGLNSRVTALETDVDALEADVAELQSGMPAISYTPSTNGYEPSGAEELEAVCAARMTDIQNRMADGSADLSQRLYTINASGTGLVAPHRGRLKGKGPGQTWIRPRAGTTGAVITSHQLAAFVAAGNGKWAESGVPTMLQLEDFGINGAGALVADEIHTAYSATVSSLNGIDILSPGAMLRRLAISDIRGVGIRYRRGDAMARLGPLLPVDREYADLEHLEVKLAFAGIEVGGVDTNAHFLTTWACRDWGVYLKGSAINASNIHAYGIVTSDGDDSRGIGIVVGNTDGSSGPCNLGTNNQGDYCRIGIRNHAAGSSYAQMLAQKCFGVGLDFQRGAFVTNVKVYKIGGDTIFIPTARGIRIQNTAAKTAIKGGLVIIGNHETGAPCPSGVGLECFGDYASIHLDEITGLGGAGTTGMILGGSGNNPRGCQIVFDRLDGMGTGVLINGISQGNRITINHTSSVTNPLTVAGGVNMAGNYVELVNLTTGVRTLAYNWS